MLFDPKFLISEETFDKCHDFAEKSVGTSTDKYARRNQNDSYKILKDIRCGKIAEEYVHQKLLPFYPNLKSPDYQIYEAGDKSWDADLKDPVKNVSIACKSQDYESMIAFSQSWVFQFNHGKSFDCDKGIFKEQDDKHFVSFVSLNIPRKTGEIKAIVKVSWLHKNNLFKDMKKKSLQGNKLAVYYDDLENFKDELWQILQ